jgi:Uma2 family endonuclease
MAMTAAPALPRHKITADEFLEMDESEGFELVDGELEEVPMGGESSWLGGQIFRRMDEFVSAANLGLVFPQETGFAIWPDDPYLVRKPDAAFVPRTKLPAGGIARGWIPSVPDLVVEVVSPRENAGLLQRKILDYRRAGIPMIWVIYPDGPSAVVWSGDGVSIVPGDGVLDAGSVIPGFRLSLAELFAALDATTSAPTG